ncbi:XRE family transcriptional regulator [bacterium]|jgi:ribosome-binding protein aMBF1 (putative translation factor)|nr:XRE family transcriptional regulator [bacterium]
MDHQDWEPVVFRKPKLDVVTVHRDPLAEQRNALRKLENEEKKCPKLALDMRQKLTQARIAYKLSQTDLAKKINVRQQLIQELESGKCIPDSEKSVLNKLQKVLNVSLHFIKNGSGSNNLETSTV